jgi:hypothetical protein
MNIGTFWTELLSLFFCVVTRTNQWSALTHFETTGKRSILHAGKFVRVYPSIDWKVISSGLQILSDRDDVGFTPCTDIIHEAVDFRLFLADPKHNSGLGYQAVRLELLENLE